MNKLRELGLPNVLLQEIWMRTRDGLRTDEISDRYLDSVGHQKIRRQPDSSPSLSKSGIH